MRQKKIGTKKIDKKKRSFEPRGKGQITNMRCRGDMLPPSQCEQTNNRNHRPKKLDLIAAVPTVPLSR